jgi:hypothetical protein
MSNLVIVDKDKFDRELDKCNSYNIKNQAQYALSGAICTGEKAMKSYISQECERSQKMLQEYEVMKKRNAAYQRLLDMISNFDKEN